MLYEIGGNTAIGIILGVLKIIYYLDWVSQRSYKVWDMTCTFAMKRKERMRKRDREKERRVEGGEGRGAGKGRGEERAQIAVNFRFQLPFLEGLICRCLQLVITVSQADQVYLHFMHFCSPLLSGAFPAPSAYLQDPPLFLHCLILTLTSVSSFKCIALIPLLLLCQKYVTL